MSDQNPDEKKSELHVDEDWKSRVKAEDAKLDAESQSAEQASEKKAPDPIEDNDPTQLPKPDFSTLVTMFSTQAMVSLGVIPAPGSDQPERNLPLAKHFIDMLGVLEEKTGGNLDGNEKNLLDSTLHQLRMVFVEMNKAAQSDPPAKS